MIGMQLLLTFLKEMQSSADRHSSADVSVKLSICSRPVDL